MTGDQVTVYIDSAGTIRVRHAQFGDASYQSPPTPARSSVGRVRISDEDLDARVRSAMAAGGWTWNGMLNYLHDSGIAMSAARLRTVWKQHERRLRPR